jgi:cation transport regulator
MPYTTPSDLPDSVRKVLPTDAQEIYIEAFDAALDEYDDDEETAHKVAWSAVKRKYKKSGNGTWVKKNTKRSRSRSRSRSPKRNNPFLDYLQNNRSRIVRENPGLRASEIAKIAGEEYRRNK